MMPGVFHGPPLDPFPPHFKGTSLHKLPHHCPDLVFRQTELSKNGIERSSVLPSHFNDAVHIIPLQAIQHFYSGTHRTD